MTRTRHRKRAPVNRILDAAYTALGVDGYPEQRPFTAAEVHYLLGRIKQIKDGRKYLKHHDNDNSARKMLERLENGFVAEFHRRNIYSWYKIDGGPVIRFEKKNNSNYWQPIFT